MAQDKHEGGELRAEQLCNRDLANQNRELRNTNDALQELTNDTRMELRQVEHSVAIMKVVHVSKLRSLYGELVESQMRLEHSGDTAKSLTDGIWDQRLTVEKQRNKELEGEMDTLLDHIQQALGTEAHEKAQIEKQLKHQTVQLGEANQHIGELQRAFKKEVRASLEHTPEEEIGEKSVRVALGFGECAEKTPQDTPLWMNEGSGTGGGVTADETTAEDTVSLLMSELEQELSVPTLLVEGDAASQQADESLSAHSTGKLMEGNLVTVAQLERELSSERQRVIDLEMEMDSVLEHIQQALGKEGEEKSKLAIQLQEQTNKLTAATEQVQTLESVVSELESNCLDVKSLQRCVQTLEEQLQERSSTVEAAEAIVSEDDKLWRVMVTAKDAENEKLTAEIEALQAGNQIPAEEVDGYEAVYGVGCKGEAHEPGNADEMELLLETTGSSVASLTLQLGATQAELQEAKRKLNQLEQPQQQVMQQQYPDVTVDQVNSEMGDVHESEVGKDLWAVQHVLKRQVDRLSDELSRKEQQLLAAQERNGVLEAAAADSSELADTNLEEKLQLETQRNQELEGEMDALLVHIQEALAKEGEEKAHLDQQVQQLAHELIEATSKAVALEEHSEGQQELIENLQEVIDKENVKRESLETGLCDVTTRLQLFEAAAATGCLFEQQQQGVVDEKAVEAHNEWNSEEVVDECHLEALRAQVDRLQGENTRWDGKLRETEEALETLEGLLKVEHAKVEQLENCLEKQMDEALEKLAKCRAETVLALRAQEEAEDAKATLEGLLEVVHAKLAAVSPRLSSVIFNDGDGESLKEFLLDEEYSDEEQKKQAEDTAGCSLLSQVMRDSKVIELQSLVARHELDMNSQSLRQEELIQLSNESAQEQDEVILKMEQRTADAEFRAEEQEGLIQRMKQSTAEWIDRVEAANAAAETSSQEQDEVVQKMVQKTTNAEARAQEQDELIQQYIDTTDTLVARVRDQDQVAQRIHSVSCVWEARVVELESEVVGLENELQELSAAHDHDQFIAHEQEDIISELHELSSSWEATEQDAQDELQQALHNLERTNHALQLAHHKIEQLDPCGGPITEAANSAAQSHETAVEADVTATFGGAGLEHHCTPMTEGSSTYLINVLMSAAMAGSPTYLIDVISRASVNQESASGRQSVEDTVTQSGPAECLSLAEECDSLGSSGDTGTDEAAVALYKQACLWRGWTEWKRQAVQQAIAVLWEGDKLWQQRVGARVLNKLQQNVQVRTADSVHKARACSCLRSRILSGSIASWRMWCVNDSMLRRSRQMDDTHDSTIIEIWDDESRCTAADLGSNRSNHSSLDPKVVDNFDPEGPDRPPAIFCAGNAVSRTSEEMRLMSAEEVKAFESEDIMQMCATLDQVNRQLIDTPRTRRSELQKKQQLMDAIISDHVVLMNMETPSPCRGEPLDIQTPTLQTQPPFDSPTTPTRFSEHLSGDYNDDSSEFVSPRSPNSTALKLGFSEALLGDGKSKLQFSESSPQSVTNGTIKWLRKRGQVEQAETMYRAAYSNAQRKFGEDHADTLAAASNLSVLLHSLGQMEQAELLCRATLQRRRATLGAGNADTLSSLSKLASVMHSQAKLEEAEALYREAIDCSTQVFGELHFKTLGSTNHLAAILQNQGKVDEAAQMLRKVVDGRRTTLGRSHAKTIASSSELAAMLKTQGKLEDAEILRRELLETHRQAAGNQHPDTIGAASVLAGLLQSQGKLDQAEPLYREVLVARRGTLGSKHPKTLSSASSLGSLLQNQGKYELAQAFFREALEGRRNTIGANRPDTLTTMVNLGYALMKLERLEEASVLFLEAYNGRVQVLGARNPDTLSCLAFIANLASLLHKKGNLELAEPLCRAQHSSKVATLGENHPEALALLSNLGVLFLGMGKLEQAEELLRDVLVRRQTVLGEQHTDTLASFSNIGVVLKNQNKLQEAEVFCTQALEGREKLLGAAHADTITSNLVLTTVLKAQGKTDQAEALCRELLRVRRQTLGADHADTLASASNLGLLLQTQAKFGEAEELLVQVLEVRRCTLRVDHPKTLSSVKKLAELFKAQGKLHEMEAIYRELLQVCRSVCGESHPGTAAAARNLRCILKSRGKFDEAAPMYREALVKRRATSGDTHPKTLAAINNYASILENQQQFEEAELLYQEVAAARRKQLGSEHAQTLSSVSNCGRLLQRMGRAADAERIFREVLEGRRRTLGEKHPKTCLSVSNLGICLEEQGKIEEAEEEYAHAAAFVHGEISLPAATSTNGEGIPLRTPRGDNAVLHSIQPNQASNFKLLQGQKILDLQEITTFNSGNLSNMLVALEQVNSQLSSATKATRTLLQKKQLVMDSIISDFCTENCISDAGSLLSASTMTTPSVSCNPTPRTSQIHMQSAWASPKVTPRQSLFIPDASAIIANTSLVFPDLESNSRRAQAVSIELEEDERETMALAANAQQHHQTGNQEVASERDDCFNGSMSDDSKQQSYGRQVMIANKKQQQTLEETNQAGAWVEDTKGPAVSPLPKQHKGVDKVPKLKLSSIDTRKQPAINTEATSDIDGTSGWMSELSDGDGWSATPTPTPSYSFTPNE